MNRRRHLGRREQRVRDLVNDIYDEYDHSSRKWFQICAAMDTIGDTALVLDSDVWRRRGTSFPFRYLRLYGLLQAIHAQEDSITYLWLSVANKKRSHSDKSAWTLLRVLRNDLTAHSTHNAAAISRMTLRGSAPTVLRWPASRRSHEFASVPFDDLVVSYTREAASELDTLAAYLGSKLVEGRGG